MLLHIVIIHFFVSEKMAANIREEIRRLHRRKQLYYNPQGDSSDMESTASPSSPSCSNAGSSSSSSKEKPLFTFRQVFTTHLSHLVRWILIQ